MSKAEATESLIRETLNLDYRSYGHRSASQLMDCAVTGGFAKACTYCRILALLEILTERKGGAECLP